MNPDRHVFERLAERSGFAVRSERVEEAARLARDNVQAVRRAFQPQPLTSLPADFQRRLEREDD